MVKNVATWDFGLTRFNYISLYTEESNLAQELSCRPLEWLHEKFVARNM